MLECLVDYPPNVFYKLSGSTYLLPLGNTLLSKGRFELTPYLPTEALSLPLNISEVRSLSGVVGYVFKSSLPTTAYSTGLLVQQRSWTSRLADVKFDPTTFQLVFKGNFYIHSADSRCCLVTTPKLSQAVVNVLTAV